MQRLRAWPRWRRRRSLAARLSSTMTGSGRSSDGSVASVVSSAHRGHLSVISVDAASKAQIAADRTRWLMDNERRVLVLTGDNSPDGAGVRGLLDSAAFYELERQGHGIFSVREFCRLMLEETGRDQRVFSRAKLAAFVLHHRSKLPFERLHRGNATAPLHEYRHAMDLLQLFRLLEANAVTPSAYTADARERADFASAELAETYRIYQELMAKYNITSWDGSVLELLRLCEEDAAFTASIMRGYTDVVVDDVQSLSPAMVQLVARFCSHPSIQSSTSFTRVLDERVSCPRTELLERLVESNHIKLSSEDESLKLQHVIVPQRDGTDGTHRGELRSLATRLWRQLEPSAPGEFSDKVSSAVTCRVFGTVTEEELGIGKLIHDKLESGVLSPTEIVVLAPTMQDTQRMAHSLQMQGLPVLGSHNIGGYSVSATSQHVFDDPIVSPVFSLLVALCFPSDSRHLYNVLRSDFFAFPAEILSQLMEKEQRSHADLFQVLDTFVETKGESLFSSDFQDEQSTPDIESSLSIARSFVKLIKSLRAECHQQSAQEIVQTFLEETGRMESLLNPGSSEEEHEAIVLAEFLRELEGAEQVVQSMHVPLVVPYLMQLRDTNRPRIIARATTVPGGISARSKDQGFLSGLDGDGLLSGEQGVRVMPLTSAVLESLAGADAVSCLVLVSMRDSKFPGRMRRITLPLPLALLSTPYPVQTRGEHIERCEQLAAFALTIPKDEVVLSYASVVTPSTPGPASQPGKREQVSRVFLPVWSDPPESASSPIEEQQGKPLSSFESSTDVPASTQVHLSPQTIKYNPSHVSYTQISEYLRCPYRYYLGRVMKLPGEVSTAMMYGRAMHEAIAEFVSALEQREDQSDPVDATNRQMNAEKQSLETFTAAWQSIDDDGLFASSEHKLALQEQGVAALQTFFASFKRENPRVEYVEHPFSVNVPEADVELRGVWDRIDRVDDRVIIKEFKSSVSGAARDMAKQARDSLQLKLYMFAYEKVFGEPPFGTALQLIGGDERANAAGFIQASVESNKEAVETVVSAVRGMRNGEFAPKPNYIECAFCPYASSACRASRTVG